MKLSEILNKTENETINIVYDNPFILNKYLKNYKLIVIDDDLIYINKKTGHKVALYGGYSNYNLTELENSLNRMEA